MPEPSTRDSLARSPHLLLATASALVHQAGFKCGVLSCSFGSATRCKASAKLLVNSLEAKNT